MNVLRHHSNWILVTEWNDASTEFIEHDSQCIDIAAIIGRKSLGLFRRDVEWIATISCYTCELGEAEIGKGWLSCPELSGGVPVEKNIAWFNAAMYNSLLMGIVNSSAQACEKIDDISNSWK